MLKHIMLVATALLSFAAGPAVAAKFALVIGNSAYQHTSALTNPRNDATAFAAFLRGVGYDVTEAIDADRAAMSEALSQFSKKLTAEDTALFYYAGHGLQMGGENYLVAVEAKLESEFDVPGETIALNSIVGVMESKAKVSMLFIDACRNNPLAESLAKEATRSVEKGLAPVVVRGDGTMVAFAATPGNVAFDGKGDNSPFTRALLTHLATPGLEVGTAFKRVIAEVRAETGDRQSPQIVSSLATEIYFDESAVPAAPVVDVAAIDYEKAERLGTARGWQLYLAKHPEGFFADLARAALDLLTGGEQAGLSPAEAETRLALTREARLEVQVALNNLGYAVGTPDGAFGQYTRRGIARYQNAVGLQETGYLSAALMSRLGVAMVTGQTDIVLADEARRYEPLDLVGLETDPRLFDALKCLPNREVAYGFFDGHLYLAVLTFGSSYSEAERDAARCGGHLVTLASKEENEFVFSLVREDSRFFYFAANNDVGTVTLGPFIGLKQAIGAREPTGGWRWVTGEDVTYENWVEWEPDNWRGNQHVALYVADGQTDPQSTSSWREVTEATWGDREDVVATGYILEIE